MRLYQKWLMLVPYFMVVGAFTPIFSPQNGKQEKLLQFFKENHPVVIAEGSAGSGKTLLSTQYALQLLHEKRIKKIVLTRPVITTGSDIGYLPGTLDEKMMPWLMPVVDVFCEFYPRPKMKNLLEQGIVEIVPLAFMRGRSFRECVIVADEMQNSTPEQMKMLLTRIGDKSRMLITGDTQQSDLLYNNGLEDLISRLFVQYPRYDQMIKDGIALVQFDDSTIVRHPIIPKILKLYP